ncbi:uncharacterized protein LOC114155774 isoform X2 [Xiphophorus couchianus]|uniref:uncharacterized protein LOC114155774 isoform X2 n=1 Tax=Xiphophorus couchianus TaxID=32473 RepID=UPI0010169EFC|nr:uncharacterized protein LOC114155774 isoform X2 [Xiphophorus couchianus]
MVCFVECSTVSLNEFINEPLTAAEETFTEFKEIIVKSEEEMDDHRRLLDFSRRPQIILHRIGPTQCMLVLYQSLYLQKMDPQFLMSNLQKLPAV